MNHYYHQLSVKEPVAEPLTLMQKQTGCDDIFCNQLSLLLTAYSRLLCHAPLWLPYSKTNGKIDTLSYFRFNASSKLKWIYKVWKNRWLITRMADSVTPVTFFFFFFLKAICTQVESCRRSGTLLREISQMLLVEEVQGRGCTWSVCRH